MRDQYIQPFTGEPGVSLRGVGAISTTRRGGVSQAPFDTLNLGLHVGDDDKAVAENRRLLADEAGGGLRFAWLEQVHETRVVDAAGVQEPVEADASFCRVPGLACVVMTADCLPVLLAHRQGQVVAAAHAGWRGLAAGVLEATVTAMCEDPAELVAWLGPAIGSDVFEVGGEVRRAFVDELAEAECCFRPSPENPEDRWVADLYGLARLRLQRAGVVSVSGGGFCTYSDEERFFSYRRDGKTGRMASAIWLQS